MGQEQLYKLPPICFCPTSENQRIATEERKNQEWTSDGLEAWKNHTELLIKIVKRLSGKNICFCFSINGSSYNTFRFLLIESNR